MEADRTVFETRASYEVMKQKRKEKDEGVVAEVVVEKPIGAHLTLVGDESTGFYDKAKLIDDALES